MQQSLLELNDRALREIAETELADKFIEEHLHTEVFSTYSQKALQQVCDDFVAAFLKEGEWIASLNSSLKECDSVLGGIEGILQQFITRIRLIQNDIGELYKGSLSTTVALRNTRAAEREVQKVMSHLVLPPELVLVISNANGEELGEQFTLAVKKLYSFLKLRRLPLISSDTTQASPRTPSESSTQISSPTGTTRSQHHFSLDESSQYNELFRLLRNLTVVACVHIKQFLSRKLLVLSKANTNIAIQQEHFLLPHAFLVHFLKNASHLLEHGFLHMKQRQSASPDDLVDSESDRKMTESIIRITHVLYQEIKSQYILAMSDKYKQKIERYLFVCNSLEVHHSGTSGSTFQQMNHAVLPLLVEPRTLPPSAFRLGARSSVLEDMHKAALIPTAEVAQDKKHYYEETYRSLNRMLCDAVTHEYLFTFSFFSGNMTVYTSVFRSTFESVQEYISDVMLGGSANSNIARRMTAMYAAARPNAYCNKDCYGLLVLIRITNEFRTMMREQRQLNCLELERFYDSVLMMLWQAFQSVCDEQLEGLKKVSIPDQLRAMEPLGSVDHKVAYIHPVSKRYAEFSSVLLGIAYNVVERKERDGTGSSRSASQTSGKPASPRGKADLEFSTRSASGYQFSQDGSASGISSPIGKEHRRVSDELASSAHQAGVDLRLRALQVLDAKVNADVAAQASLFSALYSKLSIMRVEVLRFLKNIGTEIIPVQSRHESKHLTLAFELNNLLHIMRVWKEAPVFGEETREHLLCETEDFEAIQTAVEGTQRQFIQALIEYRFPSVMKEINRTAEPVLADVLSVGKSFLASWRSDLVSIRDLVVHAIADPLNHNDILAQLCTELLLYNTRLRSRIDCALS